MVAAAAESVEVQCRLSFDLLCLVRVKAAEGAYQVAC